MIEAVFPSGSIRGLVWAIHFRDRLSDHRVQTLFKVNWGIVDSKLNTGTLTHRLSRI